MVSYLISFIFSWVTFGILTHRPSFDVFHTTTPSVASKRVEEDAISREKVCLLTIFSSHIDPYFLQVLADCNKGVVSASTLLVPFQFTWFPRVPMRVGGRSFVHPHHHVFRVRISPPLDFPYIYYHPPPSSLDASTITTTSRVQIQTRVASICLVRVYDYHYFPRIGMPGGSRFFRCLDMSSTAEIV
jgi:hypothetical protein